MVVMMKIAMMLIILMMMIAMMLIIVMMMKIAMMLMIVYDMKGCNSLCPPNKYSAVVLILL